MNALHRAFIEAGGNNPLSWMEGGGFYKRKDLCKQYAWAIPDDGAIALIAQHCPRIIEIGAGTGYWASLLAAAGCDVIAFDEAPYENRWCEGRYFDVHQGGAEAVVKGHANRALMLCWPPMSDLASTALKLYRGKWLIYIGEWSGGCTADDEFFYELGEDEYVYSEKGSSYIEHSTRWQEVVDYAIPQWDGIHDRLYIYKRGPQK